MNAVESPGFNAGRGLKHAAGADDADVFANRPALMPGVD